MDDLLSEDWQKPSRPSTATTPSNPAVFASNYSSLRASPQPQLSGTSSPANLSRPSSTVNGTAKSPAKDTFGNLLALKSSAKAGNNVSMQERQKQLLEEKRRQQEQQAQLWDNLGSGRATPEIRQPSPAIVGKEEDEDDFLAAFNKDAPVNTASHFAPPPPSGTASSAVSGRSTPAVAQPTQSQSANGAAGLNEDDDPFGLGGGSKRGNGYVTAPVATQTNDEDDVLGDLGKPIVERSAQTKRTSLEEPMLKNEGTSTLRLQPAEDAAPEDQGLAELVDMGFPPDTAKIALAENGGNVQNAVGWLLQQAHEESRQKVRGETPSHSRRGSPPASSRSPPRRQRGEQEAMPPWMKQDGRSNSAARRQDSGSPANGEKDTTQVAQDIGNKLFKSANSLWKASQKQMAKTMAEFQQDPASSDPSQPKWMRDASADSNRPSSQRRPQEDRPARVREVDVTHEAALLDAPRDRPQKPPRPTAPQPPVADLQSRGRSPVEPLPHRPNPQQPKFMQQAPSPQPDRRPTTKLSRQEVEDQTAQAYVSPARRKRPIPKPETQPQPEPDVDLFSSAPPVKASMAPAAKSTPPRTVQAPPISRPSPAPPKPKAPPRNIPSVSPSALATSTAHRKAGGEHFKRGDFAAAHESYTAALSPLPPTHPIAIVILSNHSLTALKTGDAKVAVSDADRAFEIIGPGLGVGESIDLGDGERRKEMKEFYGKALMRKAEALEHLEKYSDAATAWRQAAEAGVGGAVSLRGRERCEKAATPQPATLPKSVKKTAPVTSKPPPPSKSLGNSMQRPTITSASSAQAVKKLRAANAAAEQQDDEKFALADSVEAKLTAWKGGKAENLRALLQSMDAVLWEGAGWKKVGMSDLVMPGKVKVIYMRAIGKVHPDKIPQDATTEQRMISAAVFATLNEAWDRFKKDNSL